MSEIQKINPETAAHNIATIFSKQYAKRSKDPSILSINSSKINDAAKETSKLYAIVYDEAYGYFSKQNKYEDD